MSAAPKVKAKPATEKASTGRFSAEERAAMKERAAELKAEGRRASAAEKAADDEAAMQAKIAAMPQPDRYLAQRLCSIVADAAPELLPKLYYGQPGWAKDGKVIVFFRSGIMDKARYSTLGFSVHAKLDAGSGMWPTSYALEQLSDTSGKAITKLVKKAVS